MAMSVNPDGMDSVDYSDFEYQQIYHEHQNNSLTGSPASSKIRTNYEVLGGIGGLDNNEVAELAFMEVQVNIDHSQFDDDQDVGSETNLKGVVGANIPATADLLPGNGAPPDTAVISETNATGEEAGSVNSEDRVFAPFRFAKNPAFDDQTNGPGGAGAASTMIIERPWRSMVGRGPVLDSSDDLSILSDLTQDDEIINCNGNVTVHCVWDVAEVSDAGRAFSVPK